MATNPLKIDPSRTTMLRRRFVAEMNKRFLRLRSAVLYALVQQDVLGLKDRPLGVFNYNPHQPRDKDGRWTSGGGGGGGGGDDASPHKWRTEEEGKVIEDEMYDKHAESIAQTPGAKEALQKYERFGSHKEYHEVGRVLREGEEPSPKVQAAISGLDAAVGAGSEVDFDIYRGAAGVGGMQFPSKLEDARALIGTEVTERAFMSTSIQPSTFITSGNMMVIRGRKKAVTVQAARKGQKRMDAIHKRGGRLSEGGEMLVARGTRMRLVGVERITHPTVKVPSAKPGPGGKYTWSSPDVTLFTFDVVGGPTANYSPTFNAADDELTKAAHHSLAHAATEHAVVHKLGERAYEFATDDQKLLAFKRWFRKETEAQLLTVDSQGKPWLAKYVDSAYRKGAMRAYTDAHPELGQTAEYWRGSKEQFLRSSFLQPERVSKLKLLTTRNFEELDGISHAMSQKLGRVLAQGIADGDGPAKIARQINKEIRGINRTRARVLARTEIIHAHAEGQLDSFEDLGVEQVGMMAEWSTAQDERVCPICRPLDGVVMPVAKARGLIPRHPNCRCAWIPASVGEDPAGHCVVGRR